jgi:NAD(P)-dependent dehydrogenase (short-subunit alcohol dehydrogenase family)
MAKLDGRIALITGGDHGIGLLTAKEFVNEGAYVFITGGSHSRLAAAVKEIEARELRRTRVGRNVAGVQADVSSAGDLDRVFAQIERERRESLMSCSPLATRQCQTASLNEKIARVSTLT